MSKHCGDCKLEVEGVLYNNKVEPNIFVCDECGQFLNKKTGGSGEVKEKAREVTPGL